MLLDGVNRIVNSIGLSGIPGEPIGYFFALAFLRFGRAKMAL